MIDVAELTRQCIEEEEANLVSFVKTDSLMEVFRKNFDLWENELFPLLRMQKRNRYDFVCRILGQCGYVVSSEQVGLYLSKIRTERGTRKSHKGKKNSLHKGIDLDSVDDLTIKNEVEGGHANE